jgi:hypothetical protein
MGRVGMEHEKRWLVGKDRPANVIGRGYLEVVLVTAEIYTYLV